MIVVASDSVMIAGGFDVVSVSVGVLIISLSSGIVATVVVRDDKALVVEVAGLVELDLEIPVVVESPGMVIALDREDGVTTGVVSLDVTLVVSLVEALVLIVEEDKLVDEVGAVEVVEICDEVVDEEVVELVEELVEELLVELVVELVVELMEELVVLVVLVLLVLLVLLLEELLEIVVEVVVVVVVVEEEVVSSPGEAFLTMAFIFSTKFPFELVLLQPAETSHIEIPPKYLLFKISLVKY